MRIIIDAPDFQAEDNMAIAQLLNSIGSSYENKDEDEKIVSYVENTFVRIDDWDLKVRVTIDLEE